MILLTAQQPLFSANFTLTISSIIALSAIISPVIVAHINNHHAQKMKQIELNHEEYHQTILHKREIFENFLKAANACAISPNENSLREFGTYYPLAYMYLPVNMQNTMIELNIYVIRQNQSEARIRIETIACVIRDMIDAKPTSPESMLYTKHKLRK